MNSSKQPTVNHNSGESLKKRLLLQIKEEERLIRIYEADLAATRKRKRPALTDPLVIVPHQEEEDDWLSALDGLQSQSGSITLDTRWHDDPQLHRILPHASGIAFSSAKPVGVTRRYGKTRTRSFRFQGSLCSSESTRVNFSIVAQVEFKETASRVFKVDIEFAGRKEDEELQEIIKVAEETCNIPLLFRQLLNWGIFDRRRTKVLDEIEGGCSGIERVSATKVRIKWSDRSFLVICWKWKVSWATSGEEALTVEACRVEQAQPLAAAVLRSSGLQDLIQCLGSCEKALRTLVQAAVC